MAIDGSIFTSSDIKQALRKANKTFDNRRYWNEAFSDISYEAQKQASSLTQDYSEAISQAYAASLKQRSEIAGSAMGQGYKQEAIDYNKATLDEAFESYRKSYEEGLTKIAQNAAGQTEAVNAELEEQAQRTKEFAEQPYSYLQYLYDEYESGKNKIFEDKLWGRYLTPDELDQTGKTMRLRTWEELSQDLFTDNQLNQKGTDFYDQLMNMPSQMAGTDWLGETSTFGGWLARENEDLYNWAVEANKYDYSGALRNIDSFKHLVGLESFDDTYSYLERAGGMSSEEIDKYFESYTNKVTSLANKIKNISRNQGVKGVNATDVANSAKSLTSELKSIAKELGIEIDWTQVDKEVQTAIKNSATTADITWREIGNIGLGTVAPTTIGAVTGLQRGGPWGALIGGIAGTILGGVEGAITYSSQAKSEMAANVNVNEELKNDLVDIVAYMIAYSKQQVK